MTNKQIIAVVAPVILAAVMIPVFRLFAGWLGEWWGWFLGLAAYWIVWGGLFSIWMIGWDGIRAAIQPGPFTARIAAAFLVPIVFSGISRLMMGSDYEKATAWHVLMLIATTFGNGFFEELLWRGVYLRLFPGSILWQIIWPSMWFALWHFAPVSIHSDGNPIGMMIGSGLFGLFLSYTARWTGTAFWGMLMHTIGGIIMIL